jgi:hypothetical protein
MPMVVYCCSYSLCAFSLLVLNIVVASCWLSSGDVESSVLLLLHARTHLKKKKKKNFAPVLRVVVVTRRSLHFSRFSLETDEESLGNISSGFSVSSRPFGVYSKVVLVSCLFSSSCYVPFPPASLLLS